MPRAHIALPWDDNPYQDLPLMLPPMKRSLWRAMLTWRAAAPLCFFLSLRTRSC